MQKQINKTRNQVKKARKLRRSQGAQRRRGEKQELQKMQNQPHSMRRKNRLSERKGERAAE